MKIKVLNYLEIIDSLPLPMDPRIFEWYLNDGRQDILTNVDIFCENVRSINRTDKNFSLFNKVDVIDNETVIVFPVYLELFEYNSKRQNIFYCIDFYANLYKNNKIVFFWNHDNDFSPFNHFIENYKNVKIINFGYTSVRGKNDINLPFWTINTEEYNEKKDKMFAFIGNSNNNLRKLLVDSINKYNNPEIFYHGSGFDPVSYYKKISSSKFNLCPMGGSGGGGFSWRFFETFFLNSVPVIIVDKLIWPYEDKLDWSKLCIHIEQKYITVLEYIKNRAESVDYEEIISNIKDKREYFRLSGIQKYIYEKLL